MWGGRFAEGTSSRVESFSESVSIDSRLYAQDIRGSIAHARMLVEAGILSGDEFAAIEKGLGEIKAEIEAGTFEFDAALEDVHMNIEAELSRRIGAAGKKLHTARSRNDQVATDMRLYVRDEVEAIREGLRTMLQAVVGKAATCVDVLAPSSAGLFRDVSAGLPAARGCPGPDQCLTLGLGRPGGHPACDRPPYDGPRVGVQCALL